MTTSNLQLSRSLLVGEKVRRAAHQVPNKEAFILVMFVVPMDSLRRRWLILQVGCSKRV